MQQTEHIANEIKLPDVVQDCAKRIIDCIYKVDGLKRISPFFEITDKNIKINTLQMDGLFSEGNLLGHIFARPASEMYNHFSGGRTRVFEEEYIIRVDGTNIKCRLTNQWIREKITEDKRGRNYLQALVAVANKYYLDFLKIKEESGGYVLYLKERNFKLVNLPTAFQSAFPRRYITSLLAKPFVILTGNSGTGKTRIAKQFAEYLGVEDEKNGRNWLIVPVGADWTDNTNIMGFCNPLAKDGEGIYHKTEILKLIERANKNEDVPYFLILDEMNLSHVERYFSDFLSHMETPDKPFVLDGYKEETDGHREGELPYPDNLFIVGTVNIDETTYMFSPKVLDRANVVEFKPNKEEVLALFGEAASDEKIVPAGDGTAEAFLQLAKAIRNGKCEIDNENAMENVKNIFSSVYDAAEKSGFEFAFRTVREIRQYISAAYEIADQNPEFDLFGAIDEQLLQKVLPKIHGNKKEIGSLLDELEGICIQREGKLKLSAEKIKQMKQKLTNMQYASFI